MNVELTIQDMFDEYPTLFKERADCLNHLFCAIGNGYEWVNGELVEIPETPTEWANELASRLVDGKAFQHNKLSLRGEHLYYRRMRESGQLPDPLSDLPEADRKRLAEIDRRNTEKLPDDVYHRRPRKERWYFWNWFTGKIDYCTEYAALFNLPPDIKPDWKAAAEECRAMLREDGYVLPDEEVIKV